MENNRLQWNLVLRKSHGSDTILGLPKDGFLNSLKTLFSVRTQSTLRCLEVHSKRRYKICTCSVILGKVFSKLRASVLFSWNNVSRQWEFSWFLSQSHIDTDLSMTPANKLKVNKYARKGNVVVKKFIAPFRTIKCFFVWKNTTAKSRIILVF